MESLLIKVPLYILNDCEGLGVKIRWVLIKNPMWWYDQYAVSYVINVVDVLCRLWYVVLMCMWNVVCGIDVYVECGVEQDLHNPCNRE